MSAEWARIHRVVEFARSIPAVAADGREAKTGLAALDDCAVVAFGADVDLVVGSDFVRGEGFYLFGNDLLGWEDVGYYLVAANTSDLAAMGATPTGIVVVFRMRKGMSEADHDCTMTGVLRACADFGIPLLGGDSGGYSASVLSATAIGTCPSNRALLRGNARPGDYVYLSGDVGTAGAATAWFMKGREHGPTLQQDIQQSLLTAWRRPAPAIELGRLLTANEFSACGIDTSDGLKAAVRQIAEASEVDIVLQRDAIPVSVACRTVANAMDIDPLALAVGDSVDFRLLFTVAPDHSAAMESHASRAGLSPFRIGQVLQTRGVSETFMYVDGKPRPLPGIEWDHSEKMTIDRLVGDPTHER